MRPSRLATALAVTLACAPAHREASAPVPRPPADSAVAKATPAPATPAPTPLESVERVAPPESAYAHGWMPLASTGVDRFLRAHPTYDGRGVLITLTVVGNSGSFTNPPVGSTAVTNDVGIATFDSLFIDKSGGYTIKAKSALGDSAMATFNITGN